MAAKYIICTNDCHDCWHRVCKLRNLKIYIRYDISLLQSRFSVSIHLAINSIDAGQNRLIKIKCGFCNRKCRHFEKKYRQSSLSEYIKWDIYTHFRSAFAGRVSLTEIIVWLWFNTKSLNYRNAEVFILVFALNAIRFGINGIYSRKKRVSNNLVAVTK